MQQIKMGNCSRARWPLLLPFPKKFNSPRDEPMPDISSYLEAECSSLCLFPSVPRS